MKYRSRIYYSAEQKDLMWDRWQAGDSLEKIAQIFDRTHGSIAGILRRTGGSRGAKAHRGVDEFTQWVEYWRSN